MKQKQIIKARRLTMIELQMLDVGAPIIVNCETADGKLVPVRIQTGNLHSDEADDFEHNSWVTHGAYVAVMPEGNWE